MDALRTRKPVAWLALMLVVAAPAWGQAGGPIPLALGEPAADLVFSPVVPCRIVDTRLAGGPIAADTQRSFVVSGTTDFEAQGGTPGGCGIPDGAAAVVVNFVAVGPAGPGDLRAWTFGGPTPNASIINYASLPGLNVANGVAVPLCTGPCPSHLTVQADASATDLVADVLGFFRPFADGVITTDTSTLDVRVLGQRVLRLEAGGTDPEFGSGPNIVGGSSNNSVTPGVIGATIAGGGSTQGCAGPCFNQVTDDFGTVGGGGGNTAGLAATVGGGFGNTASSTSATVAGGQTNTASHLRATVGGGFGNTASGFGATVSGGFSNTASGDNSTVPGGTQALANLRGQMAYANSRFNLQGDAQTSLFVLRRITTTGAPAEMFLDGSAARLTVAAGRTMAFDILIVARTFALVPTRSAGYHIRGVIENDAGNTFLVGGPSITTLGEDDAAWDATVAADNPNDALSIIVTGAAGTIIRWVAVVRTAEVSEPQ
jgi:hypothetical protein